MPIEIRVPLNLPIVADRPVTWGAAAFRTLRREDWKIETSFEVSRDRLHLTWICSEALIIFGIYEYNRYIH
jgi:hypothetical protein